MDDARLTEAVRRSLLERQGKAWAQDDQTTRETRATAMAAIALIRKHAGNMALSFEGRPDLMDLAVTCAWYLAENRRAEFLAAYKSELLTLRLQEGFGVGTFEDTVL